LNKVWLILSVENDVYFQNKNMKWERRDDQSNKRTANITTHTCAFYNKYTIKMKFYHYRSFYFQRGWCQNAQSFCKKIYGAR